MAIGNFKNMSLINGTFNFLFCLELKFNDHETTECLDYLTSAQQ